jgi:hypothetical protein
MNGIQLEIAWVPQTRKPISLSFLRGCGLCRTGLQRLRASVAQTVVLH